MTRAGAGAPITGRSRTLRGSLTVAFSTVVLAPALVMLSNQSAEAAVTIPLPPALSPATLTAAVTDGVGTVSAALSVAAGSSVVVTATEVAAAAAAPVAAAGAAVTVGTALVGLGTGYAVGTGLRILWKWGTGTSPSYADPPPSAPAQNVALAQTITWTSEHYPAIYQMTATMSSTATTCNSNCSGSGYLLTWATSPGGYENAVTGGNAAKDRALITATYGDGTTKACGLLEYGIVAPQCQSSQGGSPLAKADLKALTTPSQTLRGTWYPTGSVPPPAGGGTPGTTVVTTTPTTSCQASGGTAHPVTGTPISYTGNTPSASLPAIVAAPCPAGESVVGFSTPSTGAGGATVPSPVAPWAPVAVPSAFPECNPAGRCTLVLTQVAPGGQTFVCNNTVECDGWEVLPQRAPSRTVKNAATGADVVTLPPYDPEGRHYECRWGPYELEAKECKPVRTSKPPQTGTDDPTDDGDNGCHWKLSRPWTWPYTALVCAFVPDTALLQAKMTAARAALSASPPGQALAMLSGVGDAIASLDDRSAGDCHGPLLPLKFNGHDTPVYPVDACPGTIGEKVALFVRPLSTLLIVVAAVMTVTSVLCGALDVKVPWSSS
jgi:hypothetical protein